MLKSTRTNFMAIKLGIMVAFVALALFCGSSAVAQSEKLKIVTTTSMIADAARQIGGDLVEVKALMGPGVDPHAYRQTRTDIITLSRGDLVLWHGLFLEAQMQDFLQKLGRSKTVVAVAEQIDNAKLLAHDEYDNQFDPHLWMDPIIWRQIIQIIGDKLIKARPENSAQFDANLNQHLQEIDRLATYAQTVLASVPQSAKTLVTAHDAFSYFGKAYGFDVLGIQGISTESEAGLNQISALVDLLVQRKIGAVFVESSVSDRNIRALIEGAGAKGQIVEIGGELFSDAMGPINDYTGTYIGMIDHNATIISRALGGDAPPKGMNGLLD